MIRKFYDADADGPSIDWQMEYSKLSQEIEKKDKQLKESLLLYQNMCDQITKDQQEIERLKGLIGYAHQYGFAKAESHGTIEASWQQFKQINQL